MAPWFFVDGTDGRNCQSREARQVASNLFVPEAAKNEKEFSSEDDRKIEKSVSGMHRRPMEIGRPSVPLIVADGI
jgi:hypothetical protein